MKSETDNILKNFNKRNIIYFALYLFTYTFVYYIAGIINSHYTVKFYNISTVVDKYIPYISLFIIPYIIFYIYIIIAPLYISLLDDYTYKKFIISAIIGSILGGLTFIIRPTCFIEYNLNNNNFLEYIHILIRKFCSPGAYFPSFHCFLAWLIYHSINNTTLQNIKKNKFLTVSSIICISTLFTKQHGIIDVIGGILLAEISWKFSKKVNFKI